MTEFEVIAFYYPGYDTTVDLIYKSSFLANFPNQNPLLLYEGLTYKNVEAAYQAQKFPNEIKLQFIKLSGGDAFRLSRNYKSIARQFTSIEAWRMMLYLLNIKFSNPELKCKLNNTEDTFLLEHNDKIGRDVRWSNNGDGTGTNWLGLQLMIIRDLNRPEEYHKWLPLIKQYINIETGEFISLNTQAIWMNLVFTYTNKVINIIKEYKIKSTQYSLTNICNRTGCNQPKFNGHNYCSKTCANLSRTSNSISSSSSTQYSLTNICNHTGCNQPKFNGHNYCSKTCANLCK
jgi:predicted NAD-dependent protein-ADP-ribosyltransferase YbiA (DUF1768 family)